MIPIYLIINEGKNADQAPEWVLLYAGLFMLVFFMFMVAAVVGFLWYRRSSYQKITMRF